MKYKHIQLIHETRMWLFGIAAAGAFIYSNPELRKTATETFKKIKGRFGKSKSTEPIVTVIVVDPQEES